MSITRFSALSVIMILALTAAVSPVSAQGFPIPQSIEVSITPDGGTFDESSMPLLSLFGLSGFYVDIPAGSVTETITVNISLPSDIPQNLAALQAVEFTVDGVDGPFEFLHPVTISIPYPASVDDEELLSLGYWDAEAGEWIEINLPGSIVVDTDANLVSGQVTHFSTYGVVVEEPGGNGGPEGTLTLHPQNAETVVGDTVQFEAMALDVEGIPVDDPELVWSVDDELIGTVDADGLFTADAEGDAELGAGAKIAARMLIGLVEVPDLAHPILKRTGGQDRGVERADGRGAGSGDQALGVDGEGGHGRGAAEAADVGVDRGQGHGAGGRDGGVGA